MLLLLGCQAGEALVFDSSRAVADTSPGDSAADTPGDTGGDSGGHTGGDSGDSGDTRPPVEWPVAGPSCTNWGEPVQTGTVVDVALEEISGVAVSFQNPGVLWVIEDHGNPADVVALDALGNTVATLTLEVAENDDWEDVLLVPCAAGACLLVADTGNNARDRESFAFLLVAEPLLDGATTAYTAVPESFSFSYPEVPEDCEAVGYGDGGELYLFSKRTDNTAGMYVLPGLADGAVAVSLGNVVTGPEESPGPEGAATSASFWPGEDRFLLRTYGRTLEFVAPDGLDKLDAFASIALPSPTIDHDEAVTYDIVNGGYWTIPEAPEGAPIWQVPCVD